jgi:hypothetical protein
MFAQFSASVQATNVVPVQNVEQCHPSTASTANTSTKKDANVASEQDPYILDLQDKGGYDSDGRSMHGDGHHLTISHTTSTPPPEPMRAEPTRPASPTGSSQSSEFESEHLFLRLKRQRENLLNEVAIAGGFVRESQVSAQITGISSDMVGTASAPPNLTLPWTKTLSEHVTVHDKIITGAMARNGTPITRHSSKTHPWKIGELFKENDLYKSTPFPKAYQPFPSSDSCSSEAVKLESTPHEQPFEHANAQGIPIGSSVDLSQGKITLTESALVAQENLVLRLIGAINSLDTLLQFAVSQKEHLSSDSMAEVLRHSRFDIAASSSYAWRTAHNIRLMRRQAAINVLQESSTHPPLNQANFQDLYRAPLNSASLFGGKLADIHQKLVQNMQVRPILVGSPHVSAPGERQSVMNRSGYSESQPFRKPAYQAPPKKSRAQKRQSYLNQGPPAKRQAPAGTSSTSSDSKTPPSGTGRGRGKGQGGRGGKGRGGGHGAPQ